ncbi:MAG: Unknown protein [uncultured Thiotrichaceae bacterium]|uniref:BrnT family toxin n=1 Tax=uncultured Thiotrichaceae bacterium TaxID=298394 RepID=A0A6S6S2V1_9GAMM|nr:MAG: Unknown protein [uncultured Thiotrichaceae bacterium]
MIFTWDEDKNLSNIHKHNIDVDTASLVFYDPDALFTQDRIENGEERWQTIGIMVVLIAHTLNYDDSDNEVIRIMSARKADKKERRNYESETYK